MQKITFQIPELSETRNFFVKIPDNRPVTGYHDFRGPYNWRNKLTEEGNTHCLYIDVDERGIMNLVAYPYIYDTKEYLDIDLEHPLTVIFKSIEV